MELDDLIDGYIAGTLSDQELRAVEARMMQDRRWAAAVQEYTLLTEEIEAYGWLQWERVLLAAEKNLEKTGIFVTDDDLEAYLDHKTDPEQTRLIEQLRFGNAAFAQRLERFVQIRRAAQYAGQAEWEEVIDAAEEKLEEEGFFETVNEPILDKIPQQMPPVVRALIAVGVILIGIIILRYAIANF